MTILVLLALPHPARAQCAAPGTDGLIAYWKLDETSGTNVADSAGTSNGTWSGSAQVASTDGIIGTAFQFDGVDDIVSMGDVHDMVGSPFTVCAWAKPETGTTGYIIGKYNTSTSRGFWFRVDDSPANYWSTGTQLSPTTSEMEAAGVEYGAWQHMCAVINPDPGTSTIYKNGVALVSSTTFVATVDNAVALTIGNRWDNNRDFKGALDDVRIYDRALSVAEIYGLYNQRFADEVPAGFTYYDTGHARMAYCNGTDWVHMGTGSYNPDAVRFDGTGDYLSKMTALTDVADTKMMTISFWVKWSNPDGYLHKGTGMITATADQDYDGDYSINFWGWNCYAGAGGGSSPCEFQMAILGESATDIASFDVEDAYLEDGDWHHVLISFDLSDSAKRHIVIDGNLLAEGGGANQAYWWEYDNVNIPVSTMTDWFIGAPYWDLGTNYDFDGDLADVWIDFGTYINLSIEANRNKFISSGGLPMYLGEDGSIPTGEKPDIFLSGGVGDWHINKGAGGGFTENGALSAAPTRPGDAIIPAGGEGDITTGLVAHWKLDETSGTTAYDSVGSYNGTMTGGLSASSHSVSGKVDGALNLDGTDDGITVPTSLATPADLTLAAWLYPTANGQSSRSLVVGRSRSTSCCGAVFSIRRKSDNTIDFETAMSGDEFTTNLNSGTVVPNNTWTHVAVVRSAAGSKKIYINGNLASSGTHAGTFDSSTATEFMGQLAASQTPANRRYAGRLDDVRLYNRVLSADDIKALVEGGASAGEMIYDENFSVMTYYNGVEWVAMGPIGGDPPTDGLVSHWKLNETTGSSIADSAGSNTGTWTDGTGNSVAEETVDGVLSGALAFDGAGDVVKFGDLAASETLPFSVSLWINIGQLGSTKGNTMNIISKYGGAPHYSWRLAIDTSNNFFAQSWTSACSGANVWVEIETIGNNDLNVWKHVVMTYNTGGSLSVYMNGNLLVEDSLTSTLCNGTADLTLGTASWGGESFQGQIDDVRLYNRVLSVSEISRIYYHGISGGFGDTSNDCSNPSRPEGTIIFNINHNVMQYCNGVKWIGIGR